MYKFKDKIKPLKRGFLKLCPICGKTPLYSSYIKVIPSCKKCKTNFKDYKTEDGPAYFTIFIVGHLIIPCILFLEGLDNPPKMWLQLILWPLITIILSIWLLPKIKGAFLAFQISVNDRTS